MTMLYGESGLHDLLDAGAGVLIDDAAVFGFSDDVLDGPPDWITDAESADAAVRGKLCDLTERRTWGRVVRMMRLVLAAENDQHRRTRLLAAAIAETTDLLVDLPRPPAAMTAGPHSQDAPGLTVHRCLNRLADALADPGWSDPYAIAGDLDDLLGALLASVIAEPVASDVVRAA